MKLIIDIPYGHYLTIKDGFLNECIKSTTEAIVNGTPLPKGHRFIDADEILNHAFITEDEEGDIFVQKYYCIKKEIMDNALVLFDTLEEDEEIQNE